MNHYQDLPVITRQRHGLIHFADGITISEIVANRCYTGKVRDYYAACPNTGYIPYDIATRLNNEARYEIYRNTVNQ
jgi:hypothetical protein